MILKKSIQYVAISHPHINFIFVLCLYFQLSK